MDVTIEIYNLACGYHYVWLRMDMFILIVLVCYSLILIYLKCTHIVPQLQVQLWCRARQDGLQEPRTVKQCYEDSHPVDVGMHMRGHQSTRKIVCQHCQLHNIETGCKKSCMMKGTGCSHHEVTLCLYIIQAQKDTSTVLDSVTILQTYNQRKPSY